MDPVSGGAFGDVWKCNYIDLNADGILALVAVKAFRFSEKDGLERINRQISREIGINLKLLRHDNIVPLLGIATGFGRMPELRCLVSPWMPNGTLNDYLAFNQNDLTVLDRLRMLEDISAGLRYLHSVPVMHGDITGANILIDEGGHARLIDFGLSTIVRPLLGQSHLAATTIRRGAIRYAAPELVLSDDVHELGPLEKTDIYSFGCVMLQVLSGRHPWSEIKSEVLEMRIAFMIIEGRGPQRPDGNPAIMDLDWDFIQKCLQFEPKFRPSADEVHDFVVDRCFSLGPSPHGVSGDLDTAEHPSDSPLVHPGHEPGPSVIEPGTQRSHLAPLHIDHPRTALNNIMQMIYGPAAWRHILWEVYSQGPPNALTWYAKIYIDDMNYGHASSRTKGAAQDAAAMMALNRLRKENLSL
ncbi:kinase-like domain-containing protein [Suillus clintonianus]|uniref:kinase-like domain-containing protein n=1 Tax=Suillus clintonianus TaxID=1904413 RepID=UPI001B863133|nr:kinase-like domain-containing protein [Suillus clintonianus]KAG2122940.1 kinase-like domain-containing protein [Suillus clintonianus]